jgi:hypothetical protein
MTVLDLITGSFRLLGVTASGEAPSASEASDAMASLNQLLDSWKLERLMVYAVLPQTFPLVAGQMVYGMGAGGDFNAERPVRVEKISLTYNSGGIPINLSVRLIDLDEYQRLVVPTTQSTFPTQVYIDNGFPLRKFYFFPVPTIVNSIDIFSWGLIDGFTSLATVIALPPGYERALRYNLALELAPEYGNDVSGARLQVVAAGAQDAKATIKRSNIKTPLMRVDNALNGSDGTFNWLTGQ